MENKKLLSYLLKDLEELDELFSEKTDFSFDEIEFEFIQTRIKGAGKLVRKYIENKEGFVNQYNLTNPVTEIRPPDEVIRAAKPEVKIEEPGNPGGNQVINFDKPNLSPVHQKNDHPVPGVIVSEMISEVDEPIAGEELFSELSGGNNTPESGGEEIKASVAIIPEAKIVDKNHVADNVGEELKTAEPVKIEGPETKIAGTQQELKLEEKTEDDNSNKRLGDSFLKEKSVNDLMTDDSVKLEHKISNMPVSSIQSAIGINDKFQYIRELFDGNSEMYNETVAKLDNMQDLKEAVVYLQGNFKWKKTDVSLKFVNLLKRRFPNE